MKYQIAEMLANRSGSIVNISSIAGIVGLPNASAYVAAKHGVIGITKTAALEYAKMGISINAISPGWTRTDLIKNMIDDESKEKSISSRHPTDRLVEPEEIAQTILWLCTKAPSSLTGTVIPVDGGFTSK
jgi:NAD(P)-dependent dehydrogenase (short-subunit alcohol dehydrogenase family)